MHGFLARNTTGIHYTVRIGIGSSLLWFMTEAMHAPSPLWAIISLIIVTEPQPSLAWIAFRTRMINTCMGAIVGFATLVWLGATSFTLIAALTFTAFLATCINRIQQGWRIAPITTALVISAAMMQKSAAGGMEVALSRTLEVFLGSAVALLVSALMAKIWLPPIPAGEAEKK